MSVTKKEVTVLQYATIANDYQANLERLIVLIQTHSRSDIIVAPEVILTGFDYEHFEEGAAFYAYAMERLLPLIGHPIVVLTLLKSTPKGIVNRAVVLHNHTLIYSQDKAKLFALGDEHRYFLAGESQGIKKFQIGTLTLGILICFELRFKELWQKLEGCDIILIPAKWGKPRKRHLEILSQALAVINQCFVLVSNASDEDTASSSAIIAPSGDTLMDDSLEAITASIDMQEVKKMRRYINVS